AMAPLWSDTATGMTFHSVTLALELPPYVLTAFGVAVWAGSVLQFLWSPVRMWYLGRNAEQDLIANSARQLPRGLLVLAGCTVLAAPFLYVAAWYEAVTLILFR